MSLRYPRTLSTGAHNTVIALSENEVGKIFVEDTRSDIGSEAEKMQYANRINTLVVRFVRLDTYAHDAAMLVMERLYPLDYRAYEHEKRLLLMSECLHCRSMWATACLSDLLLRNFRNLKSSEAISWTGK